MSDGVVIALIAVLPAAVSAFAGYVIARIQQTGEVEQTDRQALIGFYERELAECRLRVVWLERIALRSLDTAEDSLNLVDESGD